MIEIFILMFAVLVLLDYADREQKDKPNE